MHTLTHVGIRMHIYSHLHILIYVHMYRYTYHYTKTSIHKPKGKPTSIQTHTHTCPNLPYGHRCTHIHPHMHNYTATQTLHTHSHVYTSTILSHNSAYAFCFSPDTPRLTPTSLPLPALFPSPCHLHKLKSYPCFPDPAHIPLLTWSLILQLECNFAFSGPPEHPLLPLNSLMCSFMARYVHLVLDTIAGTVGGPRATTIMNSAGLAPVFSISTLVGEEKSKLNSNRER